MFKQIFPLLFLIVFWTCISISNQTAKVNASSDNPPNVLLIITDDQGIGDLSCHGNPWIKTPNIDQFYEDAIRLTDFHVSPVCTPTRAAIMTGRYPINNGAWATYKGRDALTEGAITMADIFRQNGYTTGLFGKWHLGDNYPVRPTDCGFDVAVRHMAGGVGELSDYWGNNYFDDVYFVNNEPRRFKGYCTDVWFEEAMKFMEAATKKPFFAYLSTNAPHSPFYVAEEYAAPYKMLVGKDIVNAEFYGMIANIDENIGKLEQFLLDKKLADNTIMIFMTDNGTSDGISRDGKIGYNMGLRGKKGNKEEGGHRVPFFIRWKNGKVEGGHDLDVLAAHVDLMPTLVGMCKLAIPKAVKLDGVDLSPLILRTRPDHRVGEHENTKERTVFVHHRQDWKPPMDVDQTCLMKDKWRLVNGTQLYNIEKDPMQQNDLAQQHSEIVQQLLADNRSFLAQSKQNSAYHEFPMPIVGSDHQQEIKLTIQHAIGDEGGIWKSEHVSAGRKNKNNTHALRIEREGDYLISCRRWPKECSGSILGIPKENPKNWFNYKTIAPDKVRIRIANQIHEKRVEAGAEEVAFQLHLEKGKTFLVNDFIEGKETYGVYYTYVKRVGDD